MSIDNSQSQEVDLDRTDRLPVLDGVVFDDDVEDDAVRMDYAPVAPSVKSDFPRPSGVDLPSLAESQLQPVVEAAIANWTTAGASSQVLAAMASVQIEIKPLPQGELGVEYPGVIYLDPKAQGYGWFVDPTPAQNDEFTQLGSTGELQAVDPQAVDRIDLLTVVEHELGHVAGLGDLAPSATSLMSSTLAPGIRREPGPVEIDAILAEPGT